MPGAARYLGAGRARGRAAIGIALGFAGAGLVDVVAPRLSATVPQGSGATTIAVRLAAHVSPAAVAAAVALALAGALIAGSFGARRATRLQPASAFAEVQLAQPVLTAARRRAI